MNKTEAHKIIEDVLDVLVEVGNGTTDEQLREACDKLFKFKDEFLVKSSPLPYTLNFGAMLHLAIRGYDLEKEKVNRYFIRYHHDDQYFYWYNGDGDRFPNKVNLNGQDNLDALYRIK